MFEKIISYPSLGILFVSTLVLILCRRHDYFIYDHRLLFVVGLAFTRSLTYYAIVDMLMWYLTDHEVPFVTCVVLSNIQDALSSLLVIFMAHSADSYVGRFRTLVFSTTAFISGVMLLFLFNPYDETWLVVIIIGLLALGKSGDNLLENVLTDLVDEVDKSADRSKKRSEARAKIWWRITHASGAISATMWVAPYALGGIHVSWKGSFLICLISLTVTLMIFFKGHRVYHQGALTHRPVQIFIRVVRARIHMLLEPKSRCSTDTSTQERSLERKPENEHITPARGENDQRYSSYKEDVKVIRSLLRMFPLWGTFFVVSLTSAAGDTTFYEQFEILQNDHDIPGQIFNVVQDFSSFVIPFLYQWTCFRHNQKLKIGVGMLCSIISCVFAWQLEVFRVKDAGTSIHVLWLMPQFFMLGCMEGLTADGLLKFFKSQVDKPVKNYGEEYMEIVICLGRLVNIGLMLILQTYSRWFDDQETNDDISLGKYYRLLVCVCSVNLIVYCWVAKCLYKDGKQDHNSSDHDDDSSQHDHKEKCWSLVARHRSDVFKAAIDSLFGKDGYNN